MAEEIEICDRKVVNASSYMSRPINFETVKGYLFVAPFLALMLIFVVFVFINGLFLSMTSAQGLDAGVFIGLENFKRVIVSRQFWYAALATIKFTAICICLQVPVSFLLACWIKSIPFEGLRSALRIIFFIPYLINPVVVAVLFGRFFDGKYCLVNWILGSLHLPNKFEWMLDKDLSFYVLAFASFWLGIGFPTIYFMANLNAINPAIYEAARIDGASARQSFFRMTLPLIRPSIIFVLITSAIGNLLIFDLIFIFTRYVPDKVTTVMVHIYNTAFYDNFDLGLASATGIVWFFIIVIVCAMQIRFLGLGRHNDE